MRNLTAPSGKCRGITIFDICHCSKHCNEIVWGGKQYKPGHNRIGKASPNKGNKYPKDKYPNYGSRNKTKPTATSEQHWNWNGGKSFAPYCYRFNKELKQLIRNRDGYICQLCGHSWITGQENLSIHHVHYDRENCYPDLITLCRRCNSKVAINTKYYEELFMNKLNDRELLFYTIYLKEGK